MRYQLCGINPMSKFIAYQPYWHYPVKPKYTKLASSLPPAKKHHATSTCWSSLRDTHKPTITPSFRRTVQQFGNIFDSLHHDKRRLPRHWSKVSQLDARMSAIDNENCGTRDRSKWAQVRGGVFIWFCRLGGTWFSYNAIVLSWFQLTWWWVSD